MNSHDLVRALDAAIDRRRGDAHHPAGGESHDGRVTDGTGAELELELTELLEVASAVEALGPAPGPSAEFRRELAARLAAAPAPSSLPLPVERGRVASLWRKTLFAAAMAAAVIALVTVGAIQASANALPGQPLYPVKRVVEWARLVGAGDTNVAMHLELARRRLAEAIAVPADAGGLLAEFSRQVTAALAAGDLALAEGMPRDAVAPPLLAWLLDARANLVAARASMPPMAWRGALALVDEAISALRSSDALTLRPVPRLDAPEYVLALWARGGMPWDRPAGGPIVMLPGGFGDKPGGAAVPPAPRYVVVPGEPPAAAPGSGGGPPGAVAPPAAGAVEPPNGSSGHSAHRQPNPTAEVLPSPTNPAVPTATEAPPVVTTAPTNEPAPTDPPAPTATPTNAPPVITMAWCVPNPVKVHTYADCSVEVSDSDNTVDELTFSWRADAGQMLRENMRNAVYYASFTHAVKETTTWIYVQVADPQGATADFRLSMRIVADDAVGAVAR